MKLLPSTRGWRDWIVWGALLGVAAGFVALWSRHHAGASAFDIYMYYYPNMLYGVQRLRAGGSGLLWNPWQNCGEPAFGISSTGFLYPANLAFLLLDPPSALRLVVMFNFAVAGVATYCLGRQLGAGRAGALSMALVFELGFGTVDLNTWGPQMGGSYVWLPAAMLFCERLLRAPSLSAAVKLGVALAVPLLPGFPQMVFLTYQLVALRTLFELLSRRVDRPLRVLSMTGLGLLLAPLLVAVVLVPGIEMARLSVRGGSLSLAEIGAGGFLTWALYVRQLGMRVDGFNPLQFVPAVAAAACWLRGSTRRVALFYALAGAVYFTLAFGPATPLFDLYLKLPLGSQFREPGRFMWMSGFAFAVLTGLGVDALLSVPAGARGLRRFAGPLVAAVALLALYRFSPNRFIAPEWVLGGTVVAAAIAAASGSSLRRGAAIAGVTAVFLGVALFRSPALPSVLNAIGVRTMAFRVLIDDAVFYKYRDSFSRLHATMTPQDRAYFVYAHTNYSLMPKSASLFAIPGVQDYEPQAARRYADYIVLLRSGEPLTNLNQFYFFDAGTVGDGLRKRLLDLAAARFVVVNSAVDTTNRITPPLYPLDVSDDLTLTVYENPQALPRARFVPLAQVVRDPQRLLRRLAFGSDDLRQVILLEESPPSGFYGEEAPPRPGTADIVVDDPERVVVQVHAPTRGFLDLADQYFPGWGATVNGVAAPIMRANYLFRAVEVPAGDSTVEFRFRPLSVLLGAVISATTVLALVAVGVVRRRRRPAATSGNLGDPAIVR